jgi:hypothetical protein
MERVRAGIAPVRVVKAIIPATRKARLAEVVANATALRDEFQTWLDGLPADYADKSDENSNRMAEAEAFVESMSEILDSLGELDMPRIRLD